MTSPVVAGKAAKKPGSVTSDSHHLFEAVTKGKIHLTRFILAASTTQLANSWDQDGRTPLIACCDIKEEGTRDQIVQILLEGGADVNMMDREGRPPLIHACEKRCNDIVKLLIHHHKIKPDMEDQYGNTALIYSAAVGNDVATELLTRNFRRLGLQVDHYNKQGNTALHVATKNGNIHCAKILAQKGRASVSLKDREDGLTPMEWCLKKGFEKDEVDFLKPNTRFYRVAKLATSLSRNRASVSLEAKSKVSPTKTVDGGGAKGRAKITLSRSKSQAMDSKAQSRNVFRQSTVDTTTASYRYSIANKLVGKTVENKSPVVSGKKIKDSRSGKEDKDKNKTQKKMSPTEDGILANPIPDQAASGTSVPKDNNADDHVNITSVKINRRYLTGTTNACSQSTEVKEPSEDPFPTSSTSGRLTGLGCSLSITSMLSSTTSLGSSDSKNDSSRPGSELEDGSITTDITYLEDKKDRPGLVRSVYSMGTHAESVTNEQSMVNSSVSHHHGDYAQSENPATSLLDAVNSKQQSRKEFTSDTSATGPSDDRQTAGQHRRTSSKADGKATTNVSLKRNPSLRDIDCEEVLLSHSADDPEGFSLNEEDRLPQSLTRLSEEEDNKSSGDQYSDGGHNILEVMTSPVTSVRQYSVQNSPARQKTTIVTHMRSSRQISQDA